MLGNCYMPQGTIRLQPYPLLSNCIPCAPTTLPAAQQHLGFGGLSATQLQSFELPLLATDNQVCKSAHGGVIVGGTGTLGEVNGASSKAQPEDGSDVGPGSKVTTLDHKD